MRFASAQHERVGRSPADTEVVLDLRRLVKDRRRQAPRQTSAPALLPAITDGIVANTPHGRHGMPMVCHRSGNAASCRSEPSRTLATTLPVWDLSWECTASGGILGTKRQAVLTLGNGRAWCQAATRPVGTTPQRHRTARQAAAATGLASWLSRAGWHNGTRGAIPSPALPGAGRGRSPPNLSIL
jgi:hypothetical protein